MGALVRQATSATGIADLATSGTPAGRELIVNPIAGDSSRLREPLSEWAGALGYTRIWLPGEVVEVEASDAGSTFGTLCGVCSTEWVDSTPDFWEHSISSGCFPAFCWTCGSLVAQWREWPEDKVTQPDDETGKSVPALLDQATG